MAAILAVAVNWKQSRPDGTHYARDIYVPEGTAIHLPYPMTFHHVGMAESGNPIMEWVYSFDDEQGRRWRFIHIPKVQVFEPGKKYPAGTYIGDTPRHPLGRSKSHLHLDVAPAGENVGARLSSNIDPLPILGIQGFGRMLGAGAGGGGVLLFAAAAFGVWYWYSSKRALRT